MTQTFSLIAVILSSILSSNNGEAAFTSPSRHILQNTHHSTSSSSTNTVVLQMTGGWGTTPTPNISKNAYAREGERKPYEPYEMKDTQEFMKDASRELEAIKQSEIDELFAVAEAAGINVKPRNKFSDDLLDDEDGDDVLDVRVQWDD